MARTRLARHADRPQCRNSLPNELGQETVQLDIGLELGQGHRASCCQPLWAGTKGIRCESGAAPQRYGERSSPRSTGPVTGWEAADGRSEPTATLPQARKPGTGVGCGLFRSCTRAGIASREGAGSSGPVVRNRVVRNR
jgi:hypothetical protein